MRILDLIGLAFSSQWRQKTRTALTLLGVVIGSCILVISLSVGTGVRKTVYRLLREHGRLRQIEVYPDYVSEGTHSARPSRSVAGPERTPSAAELDARAA